MARLRDRLIYRARKLRRQLRDRVLGHERSPKTVREDVALAYLHGSGIEIGALNYPLRVPRGVHVRYVDNQPLEVLRERYPGMVAAGDTFVAPDVIDDGERLEQFTDAAVDFVIANHVIEHTEDPIGTLEAHVRVLRPGGIVYMAVPDMRRTFDIDRPVTSVAHLVADRDDGPSASREAHYEEWARLVEHVPAEHAHTHAAELAARGASIHFHAWTPSAYLELLCYCQTIGMPFDIELFQQNGDEFLTILRKRG